VFTDPTYIYFTIISSIFFSISSLLLALIFIVFKQGVNDEQEHGHLFPGETWREIRKEFI